MRWPCFLVFSAEILVLGTGARVERIDPSVLALLKRKGIAVEVQDTVSMPSVSLLGMPCQHDRQTDRQEDFLTVSSTMIY